LDRALSVATHGLKNPGFFYFSPRGKPMVQTDLHMWSQTMDEMVLLCGRYEGVDQRLLDHWSFQEVSLGDFVLAGGEIPAYALMEGCIRLLPGTLKQPETLQQESFESGLLEYPHYTRPQIWKGRSVPEVLLSGNHAEIASWRRQKAEVITQERRPDLWEKYQQRQKDNIKK
jgi:tRNA (guanine37-N1)-methyltransferase